MKNAKKGFSVFNVVHAQFYLIFFFYFHFVFNYVKLKYSKLCRKKYASYVQHGTMYQ